MNIYNKLKEQFKKENSIIRTVKNKDNPYVMINKLGIQDPNLSWAAKGLLAYLLSLPDDWKIYVKELVNHTSSGRDHTYTVIRELLSYGYMEKVEYRYKGRVLALNYNVFEVPIDVTGRDNTKPRIVKINDEGNIVETVENTTCEPNPENKDVANADVGSTTLLIKDFNNKDFNNKDFDVDDAAEKIIALYKSFKIEKRVMPHTLRLLRENAHKFSEEVWEYIFIQASEDSVAKKYNYIKELIADFTKSKIYSLEDLERYNAKYKESKSKPKEKKPLTRFHNINQRTDKYTAEELNEILAASQKAKYGKEQDKPVKPAVFVVTEEIYQDALRRNWNEYDLNQKIKLRQYAMFNNKFMPSSWVLTE